MTLEPATHATGGRRLATGRDCICCGMRRWREVHARIHPEGLMARSGGDSPSEGWSIIRCERCGYQRTLEEPTRSDLQDVHTEDDYTGETYHDDAAEKAMIQVNFAARLRAMRRYLGDSATLRLLEIGSACGGFLEAAAPRFAAVEGYGIAVEATAYAREVLGLKVGTGDARVAGIAPESFDVVCMWDTIEHLSAPEEYVQLAHRILRPGGHLFLTTGDVDSLLARLQGRKWRLYDPPRRVHYFSPWSLGTMLFTTGFDVMGIETCAFVHSVEQVVHGLGFYGDRPGAVGRLCRWLYSRVPSALRAVRFPLDLRDIFMIVGRKLGTAAE